MSARGYASAILFASVLVACGSGGEGAGADASTASGGGSAGGAGGAGTGGAGTGGTGGANGGTGGADAGTGGTDAGVDAGDAGAPDAGEPASLDLSPPSTDLGVVDVGATMSASFALSNAGDTPTGDLTIRVPGAPVFQVAADDCSGGQLGPHDQCTFTIAFSPNAFGPTSTMVTVQALPGLSASAALSGTGRDFVPLTIDFSGTGVGTVVGGPQSCPAGSPCTFSVARTDPDGLPEFVLTAEPEKYTMFDGWSGDCSGTGSCIVVMNGPRSVTAGLSAQMVTLDVTVLDLAGHTGTLVSADGRVSCSGSCPGLSVPASDVFTLHAEPGGSSTFAAWTSGPCKGIEPDCTFPLTSITSVVATFGPQAYMFVSSATVVPGSLGGAEGAHSRCATWAANAGLPGEYRAWLSTATEHPAGAGLGAGGWIRTDGRPFARDLHSLTDPSRFVVLYPPRLDEHGTDLGNVRIGVATGTDALGTPIGTQCNDYSVTAGSLHVGDASSGAVAWTDGSTDPAGCGSPRHLYCFRSDLRVGALGPPVQPGRRIFTTSLPFLVEDLQPPNEVCRQDAEAAGVSDPAAFVAFLATTGAPAMSLVDLTGLPWKRMDGVFVVDRPDDLGTMKLLAPIDVTASGTGYLTGNVWTGATAPYQAGTATCGDWGQSPYSGTGIAGDSATSAAPEWFDATSVACNSSTTRIVCIEP